MKLIIDRIEQSIAICEKEDGSLVEYNLDILPKEIKEGDILFMNNNRLEIDEEATKVRREQIKSLLDTLFE